MWSIAIGGSSRLAESIELLGTPSASLSADISSINCHLEYVENKLFSKSVQQKFVSVSSMAYKLILQMCGPSVATIVHVRHPDGSKNSLRELHSTFSLAENVLLCPKVLVGIDNSSTVNEVCVEPEALTQFIQSADKEASRVSDPSKL